MSWCTSAFTAWFHWQHTAKLLANQHHPALVGLICDPPRLANSTFLARRLTTGREVSLSMDQLSGTAYLLNFGHLTSRWTFSKPNWRHCLTVLCPWGPFLSRWSVIASQNNNGQQLYQMLLWHCREICSQQNYTIVFTKSRKNDSFINYLLNLPYLKVCYAAVCSSSRCWPPALRTAL